MVSQEILSCNTLLYNVPLCITLVIRSVHLLPRGCIGLLPRGVNRFTSKVLWGGGGDNGQSDGKGEE